MELYLDNIGIVSDSRIKIDGLTIITGCNNSGKSTIGKVAYSIVRAVENLQENAFLDKRSHAFFIMSNIVEFFEFYRYGFNYQAEEFLQFPCIYKVLNSEYEDIRNIKSLIEFTIQFDNEIQNLSVESFLELHHKKLSEVAIKRYQGKLTGLDNKKKEASILIKNLLKNLQADPKLVAYTNTRISKSLQREFFEQIQPVKKQGNIESCIKLYGADETKYYDIKIEDNVISPKGETYFNQAFSSSIFIDSIEILDSMNDGPRNRYSDRRYYRNENGSYNDFLNKIYLAGHETVLLSKLRHKNQNVFEEIINKEQALQLLKRIEKAMPDSIAYVDNKFVTSEYKLDIRNLAMGSKMFAIIKMLLENGNLNSKTLLVLDEPETHLHPEWQNLFAEVIVLLSKILNVKIVLTTHSPNFLLALDTFSLKYGIRKDTHFYQSKKLEDNYMSHFEPIDDRINEAYATMSRPFLEMDALRAELLLEEEDDE